MPCALLRGRSQPFTLSAIGISPLAHRAAEPDCTLCGLSTSASDGVSHLGQPEAPCFAGSHPLGLLRVRGYEAAASHFQHLTALNAQEGSHSVGINKRLGLA